MCMHRRHFHNDERRLGETNELNLRLDGEGSRCRGFYRKKIAKIVNIHGSFPEARHCELHSVDLKWVHGSFFRLEVPNKSDQVAIFSDVGAVGTSKRCQVAFNIHYVLYIQWKRLIERRLDVTL